MALRLGVARWCDGKIWRGNRYESSFPRSFPRMLDALRDLETKGKFSGFPGQSKRTTVRAGAKLIELIKKHNVTLEHLDEGAGQEIIILSRRRRGPGDEGERIDYEDTESTRRFREGTTFDQRVARKGGHLRVSLAAQ